MKTFEIGVKEIHRNYIEIDAESESEARQAVRDMYSGEDELAGTLVYERTAPEEEWTVDIISSK